MWTFSVTLIYQLYGRCEVYQERTKIMVLHQTAQQVLTSAGWGQGVCGGAEKSFQALTQEGARLGELGVGWTRLTGCVGDDSLEESGLACCKKECTGKGVCQCDSTRKSFGGAKTTVQWPIEKELTLGLSHCVWVNQLMFQRKEKLLLLILPIIMYLLTNYFCLTNRTKN